MQNRAARVITGRSYEVRSETILQELGWQPLIENWKENKAVFKGVKIWNELPTELKDNGISLTRFKALLRDRQT
jgi:hypothetical protein